MRGGDFNRAIVPSDNFVHRFLVGVTNHRFQGAEPGGFGIGIEGNHLVAIGIAPSFHAIIDEIADVHEFRLSRILLYQRRFVPCHAHNHNSVIAQLIGVEVFPFNPQSQSGN